MTYTVTQEDRAAAAAISNFGRRIKVMILSGVYDDHHFVQAFARHRIETLERAIAAAVAEMVDTAATQEESDFAYNRGCSDCAAAIEELKGKSDE